MVQINKLVRIYLDRGPDDLLRPRTMPSDRRLKNSNLPGPGLGSTLYNCLGVFYNELETRIRLSKRIKGRDQKTQHSNTILAVKHRQMDDNEVSAQSMRKQVNRRFNSFSHFADQATLNVYSGTYSYSKRL